MSNFKIPRPGTGMMVAAAFIGPGTITVCSRAGASFGLTLLWALLFSAIATIVLQNMVVKLTLSSGKTLAENVRIGFENHTLSILASILIIAAIFLGGIAYESGNIAGAALALNSFSGEMQLEAGKYSIDLYGMIIGVIAIALLYIGRYKLIEKVLIALVLTMSIVFITTAIIAMPSFTDVLSGMLVPSIPEGSTLTIIGLIGTTIVPYNLFLQSGALINSKHQSIETAKGETVLSVSVGGLISMAIIITSSFVFFGDERAMENTNDLAVQLEPLLGKWSGVFMTAGFFAAGISSAITAPLAASYAVAGVMNWPANLRDPKLMTVWFSTIILGIFFYSLGIKPLQLITIAQVANGLLLPFIAVFLIYLVNKRSIIGQRKNSLLSNAVGIIIIGTVIFLGLRTVWKVIM
ncbi:MAG: Nramp family divalent metal transporter [Cyclobacteriaceae bacterium]